MKLQQIRIILLVILCILYWNDKKATTSKVTWSDVANVLKEESTGNQVLLLHEHKFGNQEISKIGKEIVTKIPTRIVSYENETEEQRQKILLPEQQFLGTTLVFIANQNDYGNSSELSKILKSVVTLLNPKQLPKVLIISQVTNRIKYEKFLNYLWSKMFLDVTILEHRLKDGCKQLLTGCILMEPLNRHYYNPFTGRSYKTTFVLNSRLFPNKLHDMKGHKLNVYYFEFPPYVSYKRNSSGDVVDVYGPDVNLMDTYSTGLNYTIKRWIQNEKSWMVATCDESDYLETFGYVDVLAIQSGGIQPCWRKFVLTSKGTRMINFVILVPIVSDEMKIETEWNLMELMGLIYLLFMPWLLSRIFKFERFYWKLIDTIGMVLGYGMPKDPRRSNERIMFIAILIFYFLQESFFFTSLSSLQLLKATFKKMETLEDVIDANLTLIIHGYMQSYSENFQKLMKKGKFSTEPLEKCAEMLINYQNVTCYGREDVARSLIRKDRNANGVSRLKILKEWSYVMQGILFLKRGSPYIRRLESISSILIESGISGKWDASYIGSESSELNHADRFKDESLLSTDFIFFMIFCYLVACLSSFFAFAGEIIVHKSLKR